MAVHASVHGHLHKDDTHKSTQACFHSFSHGCMEIYAIYFEALWSKQKGVPAALLSQIAKIQIACEVGSILGQAANLLGSETW